jgi:predicted nucleic acid-binding protein
MTMKWCFEDECDATAESVLDALVESEAWVPAIWLLEVANVLLVAERRQRLTPADSARFLELIAGLPIVVDQIGHQLAHGPVVELARRTGLSAYDACYLELAMRLGDPLATGDDRLESAATANGVSVFPREAAR